MLIITTVGDIHAYAVREALKAKGYDALLWHSSSFPVNGKESVIFRSDGGNCIVDDGEIKFSGNRFLTIWRRRPAFKLNYSILHTSDIQYASYQCSSFRRGFFYFLEKGSFCINPCQAALNANSKVVQNCIAYKLGIKMPKTLYSNNPETIKEFIKDNDNRVVFKPLELILWQTKEKIITSFSSVISEKDLCDDCILQQTPAIFQEYVEKKYELRITMIGDLGFCARINSQQTSDGKIDWRKANIESLNMYMIDTPEELLILCRMMMKELGIVFGCFDFIVNSKNEYVFLEVNQMGQFLFIERLTGAPLLDAFTELMIQRKRNLKLNKGRKIVRYDDIYEEAQAFSKEMQDIHGYSDFEEKNLDDEERIIV